MSPRDRLKAIAAVLAASGMGTGISSGPSGGELVAWLPLAGRHTAEIVLDGQGYLEIRQWRTPCAEPDRLAAAILTALATLAGGQVPEGGTVPAREPVHAAGPHPAGPVRADGRALAGRPGAG